MKFDGTEFSLDISRMLCVSCTGNLLISLARRQIRNNLENQIPLHFTLNQPLLRPVWIMNFDAAFTNHLKCKGLKSFCRILVIQQYCSWPFLKQGTFYIILRLHSVQTISENICMYLLGADLTTKDCSVKITVSVWYHSSKWQKK